jgi:hypothetical protein
MLCLTRYFTSLLLSFSESLQEFKYTREKIKVLMGVYHVCVCVCVCVSCVCERVCVSCAMIIFRILINDSYFLNVVSGFKKIWFWGILIINNMSTHTQTHTQTPHRHTHANTQAHTRTPHRHTQTHTQTPHSRACANTQ